MIKSKNTSTPIGSAGGSISYNTNNNTNTSGGIITAIPKNGINIQNISSPSSTNLTSSASSTSSTSQKSKISFSLDKTYSHSSDGSIASIQQQDPHSHPHSQSRSHSQSQLPILLKSQSQSSIIEPKNSKNLDEFSNINSFSHIHLKPYNKQITQKENKNTTATIPINQHSSTPMTTPSKSKPSKPSTSSSSSNQDQQHITAEKLLHPLSHDQLQSYNLQKQLQQKYQYSSPQSYSATLRNPHRSNSLQLPNLYETLGHLKKQSTSSSGSNSNKDQHTHSQLLNDTNTAYSTNNRSDISLISTPTFVSISSQNNHHTTPTLQHHSNLSKQQCQQNEDNNNNRRKTSSLSPRKPTRSISPDKINNQPSNTTSIHLSPSLFPVDYNSRKHSVASTSGISLSSLPASLSSPMRPKKNSYNDSPSADILLQQEHISKPNTNGTSGTSSSSNHTNKNFIHPTLPDDPDKNIFLSSSHLTHAKHVLSGNSYVSLASAINQNTLPSNLTVPLPLVSTSNISNSGSASIIGSENERLTVQPNSNSNNNNNTEKLNRKNSVKSKQQQHDYIGISNSVERLYSFITLDLELRLSSVEEENELLEKELTSRYNSLLNISNETSKLYSRFNDVLIFLNKHKDLNTVSDEIINKIKILNDSMNNSKSIFEDEKLTLISFENKINILENIKEDSLENKRYQNKIILLILILSLSSFIIYKILAFSFRLF
ncbi:hypothetical protein B5S31_g2572 [[Candida] boidinii]|nr:hypothetical protein B5S31_g2572 [[Candida] boidinii]